MKLLIFLLIILLMLFLIPIPIKISIFYSNEDYYIKLYKSKIISKKDKINADKTTKFTELFINKYKKSNLKDKFSGIIKSKVFLSIITKELKKNKFKPILKFNGYADYSLGDAGNTALFLGIISYFLPIFYKFLLLFFKIKKSKLPVNPVSKDLKFVELYFQSIMFISLGQVIYIFIIFIKSVLKSKEVSLAREIYE